MSNSKTTKQLFNKENDINDNNSDKDLPKDTNKDELIQEDSIKEYDLIDDAISEHLDEDKDLEDNTLDNYKEKVRRSGVIYISYIPEGMTVSTLRQSLKKFGVNRIFLVPDKTIQTHKKKQNYKEGWIEFTDKIMGKLCEYELNGKILTEKSFPNSLMFRFDSNKKIIDDFEMIVISVLDANGEISTINKLQDFMFLMTRVSKV